MNLGRLMSLLLSRLLTFAVCCSISMPDLSPLSCCACVCAYACACIIGSSLCTCYSCACVWLVRSCIPYICLCLFCWLFSLHLLCLCKTVNLLLNKVDRGECSAWTEEVTCTSRDDTSVSRRSQKLCFRSNPEDVCNRLNSVSWVVLMRSRAGVTCKGDQ